MADVTGKDREALPSYGLPVSTMQAGGGTPEGGPLMARTMTDRREQDIRKRLNVKARSPITMDALFALGEICAELDAERAAHELAKQRLRVDDWSATEPYRQEIESLKARLALAVATITELEGYAEHESKCVLSRWEAGRPKPDGGYQWKYGGTWYDEGHLPPCECGLADTLAAWRAAK